MVADDYQPAAGFEAVHGLTEPGFQIFEFSIDGDAQSLEGAGGGVNAAAGGAHPAGNDPGEVGRASQGPVFDQGLCYGAGSALLSVTSEEVRQFLLGAFVYDGCGRWARGRRVEAHVEGLFPTEAESAA